MNPTTFFTMNAAFDYNPENMAPEPVNVRGRPRKNDVTWTTDDDGMPYIAFDIMGKRVLLSSSFDQVQSLFKALNTKDIKKVFMVISGNDFTFEYLVDNKLELEYETGKYFRVLEVRFDHTDRILKLYEPSLTTEDSLQLYRYKTVRGELQKKSIENVYKLAIFTGTPIIF